MNNKAPNSLCPASSSISGEQVPQVAQIHNPVRVDIADHPRPGLPIICEHKTRFRRVRPLTHYLADGAPGKTVRQRTHPAPSLFFDRTIVSTFTNNHHAGRRNAWRRRHILQRYQLGPRGWRRGRRRFRFGRRCFIRHDSCSPMRSVFPEDPESTGLGQQRAEE